MARSYATFDCGIWDGDFTELSAGAQRTYFMLTTQRDIAPCGTLALTVRRWRATCLEDDVKAWLEELAERRYVVIDEDSEELLVRTFLKWDGGYKHTQRLKAIQASALAIRSHSIRIELAREFQNLGLEIPYPVPLESLSSGTSVALQSHRSVVNLGDHDPHSGTTTLDPHSAIQGGEPEPFDASAEPPSMFCDEHPNGTTESCGPCGTAKLRYKAHLEATVEREAGAKAARRQAIDACELCDENGIRLDPDSGKPRGRCDHTDQS